MRAWHNIQDSTARDVDTHEGHPIAVRNYGGERLAIECQTCHRSLFEWQREPYAAAPDRPTTVPLQG